jgi:two-component system, cell cycle sensor histidine kinase and response regulator CckA
MKIKILLILSFLEIMFCSLVHSQNEGRNVLLLNSYHQGYSWTDKTTNSIRKTILSSDIKINLFIEYFDTKRIKPSEEYFSYLNQFYSQKYKKLKFDVIISSDDDAFYFLLKFHKDLFPFVPIVSCGLGIKNDSLVKTDTSFSGLYDDFNQSKYFYKIFDIFSDTKHVVFISDQTTTGKSSGVHARELIAPLYSIEPLFLLDNSIEDIISQINKLPKKNTLVFPLLYNFEKTGKEYTHEKFAEILSGSIDCPIIASVEGHVGHGAIGGYVLDYEQHGKIAAERVIELLKGKPNSNFTNSIQDSLIIPVFDYKYLKHFNISEESLPKGTKIINRTPSFYEQNTILVLSVLTILTIFMLIMIILVINIIRRKKAEENLRKLTRAVEYSSTSIIITDTNGIVEYVNPYFCRVTGYEPAEVIGHNSLLSESGIFPKEVSEILLNTKETDREWKGEFQSPKKNGELYWESASISPITNSAGIITNFVAIKDDISERKRAEIALIENENKYRKIFESIQDLYFQIELDGRIIEISPSVERYSLLKREDLIGMNIDDLDLVLEERKKFRELILSEKEVVDFEISVKAKNVFVVFFSVNAQIINDDSGRPVSIQGSLRNITERKQAEEALRQSEMKFRELFDNAPIGYHEIDINGRLTQINKTELTMLGYSWDEMINHHVWEFVENQEMSREATTKKLLGKSALPIDYERMFRKKDGSIIPLLIGDIYIKDSAGKVIGIRSTLQDITERKKYEYTLKDTNQKLSEALDTLKSTQKIILQQERLKALGQMASGIAHDINNSLVPILGYSDLLLNRKEIIGEFKKYIEKIKISSRDIQNVIDRMKEFYRPKIEEDEFRNIDINEIIRTTLELTKHRWKDMPESSGNVIEVFTELQDNLPPLLGSESEIREALANLIINAADAMPSGGKLRVRTILHNQNLIIEVIDTGIGMDEITIHRCLDPFFTTKGDKGTGLGLSMVYGIIHRHYGNIEVESTVGKGTKISLLFPVKNVLDSKTIENREQEIPALKILCIDDNESVLDIITAMLTENDHSVTTASSGKQGLELFFNQARTGNPFDLVITDLGMPYMDGKSVAEGIKLGYPHIPIILITGWGSFIEEGSIKSIDYILKKPITMESLNLAIEQVLKIKDGKIFR